jgi:hypothetical protein
MAAAPNQVDTPRGGGSSKRGSGRMAYLAESEDSSSGFHRGEVE